MREGAASPSLRPFTAELSESSRRTRGQPSPRGRNFITLASPSGRGNKRLGRTNEGRRRPRPLVVGTVRRSLWTSIERPARGAAGILLLGRDLLVLCGRPRFLLWGRSRRRRGSRTNSSPSSSSSFFLLVVALFCAALLVSLHLSSVHSYFNPLSSE